MSASLRPRDWIVPRRGMCTAFWCGVILIFASIILLVTSRHKGRLYQSWGSVFLGCGCCLLLICLILCVHAYFVMHNTSTCQSTTIIHGYHDNDMSIAECQESMSFNEIKSLMTSQTRRGFNRGTHFHRQNGHNRNVIDLVSECHELTSFEHVTPIYRNDVNALPCVMQSDSKQSGFDLATSKITSSNVIPRYHGESDTNRDMRNNAGKESYGSTFTHTQINIPTQQSYFKQSTRVKSLPRQVHHDDVIAQAGGFTRSFGHSGMITVTPLAARRMNSIGIATVTMTTSNTQSNEQLLDSHADCEGVLNAMTGEIIESKDTVYDNFINI